MDLGGSDRMSMAWFMNWLNARRDLPMRSFLRDVFSDLVFSQHMRVALSRFDGSCSACVSCWETKALSQRAAQVGLSDSSEGGYLRSIR